MVNPPRVTLSLREDTRLGKEITFIPQLPRGGFSFSFGRPNPVVESLVDRMDKARASI
jgi:hypothetical protein